MLDKLREPHIQGMIIWTLSTTIAIVLVLKLGEPKQMTVHESIETNKLIRIK